MAVITLSRQFGSGGDEIVEKLCQTMGYRVIDKTILAKAAGEVGMSDQEIIDYCEENYKVKSFVERLFGRTLALGQVNIWAEDSTGVRSPEPMVLSEEHALVLARKAVETAYQLGNTIIIGRGAQVILKNRPGVLHVRVIGEVEDRILRVRRSLKITDERLGDAVGVRRAAQDMIQAHDNASSEYLRRFYDIDWDDIYLYHVVLNTSQVSLDMAVQTIIEMARQPELETA